MLGNKMLEENLDLFIENKELNAEICRKEIENVQLLGKISDHEENKKGLEKFILKIKEDEIDMCLDSIYTKKRLECSERAVKNLEKYIEYLKDVIKKCIIFSDNVNKLINRDKNASVCKFENVELNADSEEMFRETLKSHFKMNDLLYEDIKEELKYRNKYKQQKRENIYLKNEIERLTETRTLDVIEDKVPLYMDIKARKSKLSVSGRSKLEIINLDCLVKNNEEIQGVCGYCNNGQASSPVNDDSEKDYLLYSVKQLRKENYALKQKIFEHEFNDSVADEVRNLGLKLEEKQKEIEDLEKEYSLWVLNLQEENSELRIIISNQEKEEEEFIKNMNNQSERTKQEYTKLNEDLIKEYEIKLSEKTAELNRIKNENMFGHTKNTELESIKRNLSYSEENLKKFSEENLILSEKLKKLMQDYERCKKELYVSEKEVKSANEVISNLKETQAHLNDKLNHEKSLHDKFEQETLSLKKELDNFLSDVYKGSTQKKNRGKIIGEGIESEHLGSIETIITHCKELENKVEELTTQLENTRYESEIKAGFTGAKYQKQNGDPHGSHEGNNAEIETLFDQVQGLKKEREQLKKDIRQRDWAKVEVEMLQKKTLEEVEQLKRDNARLMLENLRLKDLTENRNPSQSNENTQINSSRSSLNKFAQGEHTKEGRAEFGKCKYNSGVENATAVTENDGGKICNLPRSSIQTILNLKPPKRQSLLLFGQKQNRDSAGQPTN
ncbi:hypothetical protein FG386_000373 [Cryptosporidium ryanae]|uniref:uncharacterized protein n=1 Tax=Cryptosporidium ryanae TaxID=515981 RepID=UPI00351A1F1F|nr:hypothetical protein FG386_000373 [Cryptosporidium ryanae]